MRNRYWYNLIYANLQMDTLEFHFGTMHAIEIDIANNQLNYFRVIVNVQLIFVLVA